MRQTGTLRLYNIVGVEVKNIELNDELTSEIYLANLPVGVYVLKLSQKGEPSILRNIIVAK